MADFLNTTCAGYDYSIMKWAHSLQTPVMNHIMKVITFFGSVKFCALVGLVALLCYFVWKKYRDYGAAIILAAGLGGGFTNFVLKPIVMRPRPFLAETSPFFAEITQWWKAAGSMPETGTSFPSGHTTFAFALFVAILCVAISRGKKFAYWFIPLPFLVGFSRIYFYVHYPSDVTVGMIVGIVFGLVGYKLSKFFVKPRKKKVDFSKPSETVTVTPDLPKLKTEKDKKSHKEMSYVKIDAGAKLEKDNKDE